MMKRKIYNDDFKKTIVDLYQSGSPVKDLSSEYSISEVTIYKWIKQYTPVGSDPDAMTPKEMAAMQKEMLRLKKENEILKKAMTKFAKKLFQFIECWYNRKRIHSRLGYRTPQTVEDQLKQVG